MNTALNATAPTFQPKEPTMTKLRIVLALLVALVLPVAAEAISNGCLPIPFPTPTPPVVQENVSWGFGSPPDTLHFEIWRQSCLDGSGTALLLRASLRLKASYEYYDFSDFESESVFHLGIAGPF